MGTPSSPSCGAAPIDSESEADQVTRSERTAVYPGSFDPLTLGHDDIVRRSLKLVDRLIVTVAYTATQVKQPLFEVKERVELLERVYADEPRVEVSSFQGLLVDFARSMSAPIIIRGLRAVSDFEYEFQMALMNRSLWPEIEVIFMAPASQYTFLSSSLVREVARLGGRVADFVPPVVLDALIERVGPSVAGE
ncbi:MAG: pantetheine-phosphate adenylyltransferase [Gemmatimonadetes bacterium]|nr:pantetheine-phosphate adenylyltransferase [Gemmatimonadota bacterium]